ncbi:50S ribosomal protein L24 [Parvularcula bermudensis HTCC2503]|uniref:Large ribosomal subunit protein uL24 n=1 Tax=Parvularcula bermudensis (strain ATCC BAA-594 / HTCC2503 / KCTC 12087) TaxID=314260 RepID=E0TDC9_PARBH|nr:50S ribosomal protein L24 [Parvularcula bermudensis]ADM09952.1 50S ribosomal protein L24 [Parvularcula bermudensis HTCC2503]
MAAKIKKGDRVIVLAGRDRGAEGEVVKVDPKAARVTVQGVNMIKRHQKPSQASAGGIITREAPIHVSNVAIKDPKDGKPTRVGFKFVGEGEDRKKVRVAKRSGEVIDV